jgi:hypothetical protein
MLQFIIAIFFILHGLVHLLYLGQSAGVFELQPGMIWPQGSWALVGLLGAAGTRAVGGALCVVAALGFGGGGIGLLLRQAWWRPAAVGAALLSSALFILCWDGTLSRLDNQGAIGILINVAILVAVLGFGWPRLGF